MTTILNVLMIAALAGILLMHVLSVFARNTAARLAAYLAIALHIVLFAVLLLRGTEIAVAVLIFMGSVFCYTVLCAVKYALDKKKENSAEEVTDK